MADDVSTFDPRQQSFESLISAPNAQPGYQAPFSVVPDVRGPQNASEAALQPTTLAQLRAYRDGQVVQLPDFADGQPLVARMRRPSMLMLAKAGKIPNQLLTSATDLFGGNTQAAASNPQYLSQMLDIVMIICREALIEPTLDEIEEAGLQLSDDQMMAIFNYTQVGVRALKNFRQ